MEQHCSIQGMVSRLILLGWAENREIKEDDKESWEADQVGSKIVPSSSQEKHWAIKQGEWSYLICDLEQYSPNWYL